MEKFITAIFLLLSNFIFSQLKAKVINSETNKAIPYVNIWIENENIGTTANEKGEFIIDISKGNYLMLSCLGYENRKVKISSVSGNIILTPKTTELDEIIISSNKNTKETTIGKFDDFNISNFYSSYNKPEIKARFFPYDTIYNQTPFLKKIKFRIHSKIKNAKYNIRLYSVDKNGKPASPIHQKNIIGTVQKGLNNNEVNLSELDIIFPKEGLFVSFEWLIITQNEFKASISVQGSKKKSKKIFYEPSVGLIPVDNSQNSWIYKNGKWTKNKKITKSENKPLYNNKFGILAAEITLTN